MGKDELPMYPLCIARDGFNLSTIIALFRTISMIFAIKLIYKQIYQNYTWIFHSQIEHGVTCSKTRGSIISGLK